MFCEENGSPLILADRFSVMAVSAGHQHSRPGRRRLREVEIPGDMEAGPALEEDFFDSVTLALQRSDDDRIQGSAFGERTDLVQKKTASFRASAKE